MDCGETSIPKSKMPLQKELLQVGEVLVLLTDDTSCHGQGICIYVYSIVIMHHGKVGCMLIVNGNMHLVRDIEDRIVPGTGEGALWILKSLDTHEMIPRDQNYALEVRHEYTIAFQELNLPFIIYHLIVKGHLIG